MTLKANSQDTSSPALDPASDNPDLISPVLYDLVMWGFAEMNNLGQRVLRGDIQARLDGHGAAKQELPCPEGNPLYVGFCCQACWEAAVTLVTYGQHLCARPAGSLPCHRP